MLLSVSPLVLALLASTSLAAPSNPSSGNLLQARAADVTCKNTGGNFQINLGKAEGNIHAAPVSDGATRTSYPHEFKNFGNKIKFPNSKCHPKPVPKGFKLLEFPVFKDGHLYPFNHAPPKPDPGPARAVFTSPSKDFCGVMAHTEKNNQGHFALCT